MLVPRHKIITLENNKKFRFRYVRRQDVECVWSNFNEVLDDDDGPFLPSFEKVTSEYEKLSWFNELIDAENLCIVAEDVEIKNSNNIIAQCTIENVPWEASVHVAVLGIIVRKKYRYSGLGCELIKFSINEAIKKGKTKITLSTFATNEAAIHLYEKLGFKHVGTQRKQFLMNGNYIDEYLMELWIGKESKK